MAFLDENGLAELWSIISEWGATDATKTMYGLNEDATPNTIFQKLAMPYGYYGFNITLVTEDGTPLPNVTFNGVEDFEGNTPVTDENGHYGLAVSESGTPTLTISDHIGIVNYETTLDSDPSHVFTPITIVVPVDTAPRRIDSSSTKKIFVPDGYVVDLCCVGGGGGGGQGFSGYGGAGGGGGYCTNLLSVDSIKTGEITFAIAGGGAGASGTFTFGGEYGGTGGTTSVKYNDETLLTATGGSGGQTVESNGIKFKGGGAGNGDGGSTKGNGTTGANGGSGTVYLFEDTTLGLAGGGGGGGSSGASGGAPYGGNASGHSSGFSGGKGPGGGGGGNKEGHGAGGAAGAVYVRVRVPS